MQHSALQEFTQENRLFWLLHLLTVTFVVHLSLWLKKTEAEKPISTQQNILLLLDVLKNLSLFHELSTNYLESNYMEVTGGSFTSIWDIFSHQIYKQANESFLYRVL